MSFVIVEDAEFSKNKIPVLVYAYIVLAIILPIINIIYQIRSFRFYRKVSKQNLDKKLSKFLWIGSASFNAFLLFLVAQGIYNNWNRYLSLDYKSDDFLFMSIIFFPALLGLLEVSLLKKRIKQLKIKRGIKEEIDDIRGVEK
ncbi:hypothetical protein [uncultured Kordia sp.]|uniref:hypothetical protein n=1 Tax=uncultured Kordia sp. TaxID=507699 RepID=UPI002629EC55|nr:hypothetical protein [uncultured Kordia sp.]